jgi:hypothetical protein
MERERPIRLVCVPVCCSCATSQGGQFDEDDEISTFRVFGKILFNLKAVFPFVTYYSKYVRSFEGHWGFMLACKTCHFKSELVQEVLRGQELYAELADDLEAQRKDHGEKNAHSASPATTAFVEATLSSDGETTYMDRKSTSLLSPPVPTSRQLFGLRTSLTNEVSTQEVDVVAFLQEGATQTPAPAVIAATRPRTTLPTLPVATPSPLTVDPSAIFDLVDHNIPVDPRDGNTTRLVELVSALLVRRLPEQHSRLTSFDGVSFNGMFAIAKYEWLWCPDSVVP